MEYQIIPVTPFQQNCTLLWDPESQEAVVVDPGGEIEKVLAVVNDKGLNLKAIWLTHGHLDHIGGTAELVKKLDLPVIGPHKADAFWINAITEQCQMFGFPNVDGFEPDRWLEEGDTVVVGNLTFDVIHLPGHTPGHVAFVHKASEFVLVGDVLFKGSIGRTDFPKGNHEELLRSINDKLIPLGESYSFVPGHGPMSTLGVEKSSNPFVSSKYG